MLVLTRKPGEGIVIGDDVRLKIIEIKGGTIRLGIEAPRDKKIYREEVYERIMAENIQASKWDVEDLDVLSNTITVQKKT